MRNVAIKCVGAVAVCLAMVGCSAETSPMSAPSEICWDEMYTAGLDYKLKETLAKGDSSMYKAWVEAGTPTAFVWERCVTNVEFR